MDSIKLKNLIQPILVKKSYLYLGTPPLINTNSDIRIINFRETIIEFFITDLTKKIDSNDFE